MNPDGTIGQEEPIQSTPETEGNADATVYLHCVNTTGERMEPIKVTCYGKTGIEVIDAIWATMKYGKDKYGLRPFDPAKPRLVMAPKQEGQPAQPVAPAQTQSIPHQITAATIPPAPTAPIPLTQPAPATTPAPGNQANEEAGTFICNRFTITPEAGKEKMKVDFYDQNSNLKYPVIPGYFSPADLLRHFSQIHEGWTLEHFNSGQVKNYTGLPAFAVNWHKGKPKQKGVGFYKDIVSIVKA